MLKILLGVTGSVAAIKTSLLAEKLLPLGEMRIVLTQASEYFIQSQLETLKQLNVPIYRDHDEWPVLAGHYPVGDPILHIELRRWADCLVIAPLDANTLAKITHGICDNLLTSTVRAWDWNKPLYLCPAMNTMMWENPPTAAQINQVIEWGAKMILPINKKLACHDVGMGGMAEVETIVETVGKVSPLRR